MSRLKFSKEEKELMKKAYDNALDVLDDLWDLSEYQQISVSADLKGIDAIADNYPSWDWYLTLNDKEICLENRYRRDKIKVILEQKSAFSKKRKYDFDVMGIFLKEFESIKSKVETRVKQGKIEKSKSLREFELLEQKYSKESRVEIELPETLNPHHIEIKQEAGETIGKINFGSGIIKIITRGSITVERHDEPPYVKRR